MRQTAKLVILTILSIALIVPSTTAGAVPSVGDDLTDETSVDELQAVEPQQVVESEELLVSSVAAIQSNVDESSAADKAEGKIVEALPPEATPEPPISTKTTAPIVEPELSPFIPTDQILISSFRVSDGLVDFVELHNSDNGLVALGGLSVMIGYQFVSDTDDDGVIDEWQSVPCATVELDEYIEPKKRLSLVRSPASGAFLHQFGYCESPMAGDPVSLTIELRRDNQKNPIVNPNGIVERLVIGKLNDPQRWDRRGFTSSYRDGILAEDFRLTEVRGDKLLSDPLYSPPAPPALRIVEILPSPKPCSVDDVSLTCRPYVKVINDSDSDVDLSAYRLRGGELADKPSTSNTTKLNGIVSAGSFAVIHQAADSRSVALDKSVGTVWFEDYYGVKVYGNSVMPYEKANTVQHKGRAWSYSSIDRAWKWGWPSPDTQNTVFDTPGQGSINDKVADDGLVPCAPGQYRNPITNRCKLLAPTTAKLKPCGPGEYRNPETNRCKKLTTANSTLKPCGPGEYRNPETNRCKKLTNTTSTLKPCGPGEYRNPATNRCKKITSINSSLKPCEPGYERNPETNRCRKIAVAGALAEGVDFPVQEVRQGTEAFVGWWALGGLLILGAGYATYEWRHEIASATRSLRTKLSSKGK